MASHRKVCKKVALVIIRGKPFSLCLSARKVTFNIRSRKCDPRHVGQFERLQNHSNFDRFGFLHRNNNKSWKFSMEKETLGYRAPLKFSGFGFIQYAFVFVYDVRERLLLGFFSLFKAILMQKTPPFSKLSLNLAQFNGRFIENCKNLLPVCRLRTLRFSY